MKLKVIILLFLLPIAVGGCATVPRGPSVKVLPGSGKTFEQFQADDAVYVNGNETPNSGN
jgi:hypothetical protein